MQKKKTKRNEIDLVIFDVNQTMFSLNALKIKSHKTQTFHQESL